MHSQDSKLDLETLKAHDLMPGGRVKFVHAASMTQAYWDFEAGADLKVHSHPHEQIVNLLEGELEFTLGEETYLLKPGSVVVCPPNVPHGGKAIKASRVLDIFSPVREYFVKLDRGDA